METSPVPFRSKAQSSAFHAAAEGRGTLGIPEAVAKKFIADSRGQKFSKLPERVQHKHKGGAVARPSTK